MNEGGFQRAQKIEWEGEGSIFRENLPELRTVLQLSGHFERTLQKIGVTEADLEGDEHTLRAVYEKVVDAVLEGYAADEQTLLAEYQNKRNRKHALRSLSLLQGWRTTFGTAAKAAGVLSTPIPELPPEIMEAIHAEEAKDRTNIQHAAVFLKERGLLDDDLEIQVGHAHGDVERDQSNLVELIVEYREMLQREREMLEAHLEQTISDEYRVVLERDIAFFDREMDELIKMNIQLDDSARSLEESAEHTESVPDAALVKRAETHLSLQLSPVLEDAEELVIEAGKIADPQFTFEVPEQLHAVSRRSIIFAGEKLLTAAEETHRMLENALEEQVTDLEREGVHDEVSRDPHTVATGAHKIKQLMAAMELLSKKVIGPISEVLGLTSQQQGFSEEMLSRMRTLRALLLAEATR